MAVKSEPVDTTVPPSAPTPAPAPPKGKLKTKRADNSAAAKMAARKALWDFRKAIAWPLYRWPIEKRAVEEKTMLHLPRNYMALGGEEVVTLWPGMDVNQAIHRHYMAQTKADAKDEVVEERQSKRRKLVAKGELESQQLGANYVAGDEIVARRHEYLGPDPRVAGIYFDYDGEIHVKWWDGFLQVQWMDKGRWTFDVTYDDEVGKWVEKED